MTSAPLPQGAHLVTLSGMSTERKPSDDLREGLGLLFRAATGAVREVTKEVDLGKAAQTATTIAEQASKEITRLATLFAQTFEREIEVVEKAEPTADPRAERAAESAESRCSEASPEREERPQVAAE